MSVRTDQSVQPEVSGELGSREVIRGTLEPGLPPGHSLGFNNVVGDQFKQALHILVPAEMLLGVVKALPAV